MQRHEVEKAVFEAERFLERAREVLKYKPKDNGYIWGCKETSSLRRSSLDLTRQLAQMRKPN